MTDIKQQMKVGVLWTAVDKYTNLFITLLISMVLARMLTPSEFGIVATATVLMAFLTIMVNFGLGPAIIQRKDLDQQDLDNLFTFSFYLGIALGLLSFAFSWLIADFYEDELLRPVVQILSLGLFLSSINMVPSALMSKNLRFKEMATRSIVFNAFFGLLGIIAAFYGAGVYALVCPQILASFFTFLYNNHFYPVHLTRHFSLNPVKKVFNYSFYVFINNIINYFSRNLDKLIIGKVISADALGYYDKSYRLMQMPLTYISSIVSPVMQPIMSSMQDNLEEMAKKYTKIIQYIASLAFPIAVILFFAAEDIIYVLFGATWMPAVPCFRILAFSIPFSLLSSPNGPMYLSCNATKHMFYCTIIGTTIIIISFVLAAIYGKTIESFAFAWTINEFIGTSLSYYILYVLVMKQSLLPVFRVLTKPLLFSCFLAFVYFVYGLFVPESINHIINLIARVCLGGLLMLIYLQFTKQFDVLSFVKNKINRK